MEVKVGVEGNTCDIPAWGSKKCFLFLLFYELVEQWVASCNLTVM